MNKNIYKEYAFKYINNGMSVIPDKYQKKLPAIRSWSDYCFRLPTTEEVNTWSDNFSESNISLALGEASGVIAIDVDTTNPEILEFLKKELYPSPVEKVGSKGMTRFYRYTGEVTEVFKYNGEVVFELLSNKKKTTLPPSLHPNGERYHWSGKSLLEVNSSDLPALPPYLLGKLMKMIIDAHPCEEVEQSGRGTFHTNGRNDTLVKMCFSLIGENASVDDAVRKLVEFDKENHLQRH